MVTGAYLLFVIGAPLATFRFAPHRAVWIVYAAALLLLPATVYPMVESGETFVFQMIGGALPSDRPLSSAMIASFAALLTVVLRDGKALAAWRPHWTDLPIALFCLWPLAQALLLAEQPAPAPAVSSLTLALVWGVPWILGRIYLGTSEGRAAFVAPFAWIMALLAPIALAETLSDWRLHEALIGPHPFSFDGIRRYIGHRPLLLFENGNQYGLYVCLIALLAVARALGQRRGWRQPAPLVLAIGLVLLALASQSIGAIGLSLLGGAVLLFRPGTLRMRMVLAGGGVLAALALVAYSTGQVPVRELAERSGLAAPAKAVLDGMGRHSLAWRASQNDKTSELIRESQPVGHGRWDWFAEAGTRPWGFWSLLVGQFGLIGAATLLSAAILAIVPWGRREEPAPARTGSIEGIGLQAFRIALAIALLDAVLNSFIFYPLSAIMAACMAGHMRPRESGAAA